jgi:hypothetical protein
VAERYFTADEVGTLILALSPVMEGVMRAHAEATEARERLRAERARIAQAGGGVVDQAGWRTETERIERLGERVQAGLAEVVRLGGAPKDLGLGLVDFPHLRDGRVVNLCWRHGEREVRWWHGLDEGYAARKPL